MSSRLDSREPMPSTRRLNVRMASLAELQRQPTVEMSPRERARRVRDRQLQRAINEAAVLPASMAIVIEPTGDETLSTLRLALKRLLDAEPRALNWGVRGDVLLISRGEPPSRYRSSGGRH